MKKGTMEVCDVSGIYRTIEIANIISASSRLAENMLAAGVLADNPESLVNALRLKIGHERNEQFGIVWTNKQLRIIETEVMFTGTIDQCLVYPRNVLESAIRNNASSCFLFHNHPSGHSGPSEADKKITNTIKATLNMIGVETLDHIIITAKRYYSFAQHNVIFNS